MKYLLLLIPFALSFSCSPAPEGGINKAAITDSLRAFICKPYKHSAKDRHCSVDTLSIMQAENISARAAIDLQLEYGRQYLEEFRNSFRENFAQADSLTRALSGLPVNMPGSQRGQIISDLAQATELYRMDSLFVARASLGIDSLKHARPSSDSIKRDFIASKVYYICSYEDVVPPYVRQSDTAIIRCSFDEHYKMWSFVYDMDSRDH